MDFKTLVEQAKNGNTNAWSELFGATRDMVYFNALKLCKNEHTAQDLVQEAYIKAVQNINNLKVPEAFVSWMRMISINVSRNFLAKKSPELIGEEDSEQILAATPEVEEDFLPEEFAMKRETARLIMKMVDALPEKQRVVVILHYYNDLSVQAIAEQLCISENTVKSRLRYARASIKEQVEEMEKNGTKLRAAVPTLGLVLKEASKDFVLGKEASDSIFAAVTSAVGISAATTAGTVAATGGLLAKIASLPLITKIVAGVVAAGILIGGGVAITLGNNKDSDYNDDRKTQSEKYGEIQPIVIDGDMEEFCRNLDLKELFTKNKDEILDMLGEPSQISGGELGVVYSVIYEFLRNDNHVGALVFSYESTDSPYPYEINIWGDLFSIEGIKFGMKYDEVKKILSGKGYVNRYSDSYEEETDGHIEYYRYEIYSHENNGLSISITVSEDNNDEMVSLGFTYNEHDEESVEEPIEEPIEEPVEEPVEEPIEEPIEEPVDTPVQVIEEKVFVQVGSGVDVDVYIPKITIYSDGTFEMRVNIYYAVVNVSGSWTNSANVYHMTLNDVARLDSVTTDTFDFVVNENRATVAISGNGGIGVTENGAVFELEGDIGDSNSTYRILEEFRLTNRSASDGSISYAYEDLTHDGIEELIVMTNSKGPTINDMGEAYFEVFTLKNGSVERIYKDGTGFTTNSTYDHYLYREDGKSYIMTAAFFERQGSPWYFYFIYYLDFDGNKIMYKTHHAQTETLEHTAEEMAELEAVKEEYARLRSLSDVLVKENGTPDEDGFWAEIGWWYKDYR